jgi:hypothetical protein
VEADDERERVGASSHERFIVDMKRVMRRIAASGADDKASAAAPRRVSAKGLRQ